jgi:hypothetical protein
VAASAKPLKFDWAPCHPAAGAGEARQPLRDLKLTVNVPLPAARQMRLVLIMNIIPHLCPVLLGTTTRLGCRAYSALGFCGAIVLAGSLHSALGATVYDESVSGDLSNSGLTPTLITLSAGENDVFGTTGRQGAVDRDYFTFTVPSGFELAAIDVLPVTTTAGVSFIGVQSGTQVTLPVTATSAAGLLGWHLYAPLDGNIIGALGIPANGSSGFTPPLGAGDYAFWVQEFSAGTYNYGFDFHLVSVPESGPGLALCAACFTLMLTFATIRRNEAMQTGNRG